jgi:small subunit ribosomal protein S16
VAVKIKLKRLGKIRAPHYRIVVADARTKRDGRAIEEIGIYQPTYDKGLPAPAPLKVAEPKVTDFSHLFAKAVAGFEDSTTGVAITPKAKKSDKKDEAAAESDAPATEA